MPTFLLLFLMAAGAPANSQEPDLRKLFAKTSGLIVLPAGIVEVSSELRIPDGATDLEVRGHPEGTVLRAGGNFNGRAVLACGSGKNLRFAGFTIDGNRAQLEAPMGIAPYDVPFARFYPNNGLLAEDVQGLRIENVTFRQITNFAVLISASRDVLINGVKIESSGSRNEKGRNNTSGGILLEEGTADFQVERCTLHGVRGNGIWTHSRAKSPRNQRGLIRGNSFRDIARDAIQVGHASGVHVEDNSGSHIGYPVSVVDVEGGGVPVAIDTAGIVDGSVYSGNHFEEVNGKCIDLDGFHSGAVRKNVCVNRGRAEDYPSGNFGIVMNNTNPGMESEDIEVTENLIDGSKFGAIFVIGRGHVIRGNRFLNLNLARCNENAAKFGCLYNPSEPDLLRSGIYLARKAERNAETRKNTIENNVVSGWNMKTHCIVAAPGVQLSDQQIAENECRDGEP
ncbi:MAG: right-handed parallel beta-helix repeat-containing protein [Bryobacteraceae bacterium]